MTMDTGNDAETADFLRSLRSTTQEEVDEKASGHEAQIRYGARWDRHTPAAH